MMKNRNNRPPVYDYNNLDEDHEICFDYDSNGNLIRIRKVRRVNGAALILILVLLGVAGYVFM